MASHADLLRRQGRRMAKRTLRRAELKWKIVRLWKPGQTLEDYILGKKRVSAVVGHASMLTRFTGAERVETAGQELESILQERFGKRFRVETTCSTFVSYAMTPSLSIPTSGWSADLAD